MKAPHNVPHFPTLTPATGGRTRPAATPVAPPPTEPGASAEHTHPGCPVLRGSAPCICVRRTT